MGGGGAIIFVYIILFVGVFYFLAVRPQRRQRHAHQEMLTMLKKGDEVVTIGGMFGTIKELREDYVVLEVANRVRVKYLKRAISQIVSEEEEEDYEEYEDEDVRRGARGGARGARGRRRGRGRRRVDETVDESGEARGRGARSLRRLPRRPRAPKT